MPTRKVTISRSVSVLALSALAATAVLATPKEAHAEKVSPTAKGIVGTAFLGGEIVVFGEAIFGVRSPAAYIIGAGVGAAGGAVGGYFIEQSVSDGRIPAYLLAGGMALLIPAIVVALDATRYLPTAGAREDKPVNLPPANPGKPGGSSVVGAEPTQTSPAPATTPPPSGAPAGQPSGGTTPAPSGTTPAPAGGGGGTQAPARAPLSLIDLQGGALRMGVPVPDVRPLVGAREAKTMGVAQTGSEVRFPVVAVTF